MFVRWSIKVKTHKICSRQTKLIVKVKITVKRPLRNISKAVIKPLLRKLKFRHGLYSLRLQDKKVEWKNCTAAISRTVKAQIFLNLWIIKAVLDQVSVPECF